MTQLGLQCINLFGKSKSIISTINNLKSWVYNVTVAECMRQRQYHIEELHLMSRASYITMYVAINTCIQINNKRTSEERWRCMSYARVVHFYSNLLLV